jgi:hypothetical protein
LAGLVTVVAVAVVVIEAPTAGKRVAASDEATPASNSAHAAPSRRSGRLTRPR